MKKHNHRNLTVLLVSGAAALATAVLLRGIAPQLYRYFRIRRM
jgi:hypothetical protein